MIGDTIEAVKKQERDERTPFIVPEEFWIDYEDQADGSKKPIEWVRWIKKGMQTPATVVEKISRQSRDPMIWGVLKPYYDSWKAGQGTPISGTPLIAWPGATPQLVKALEPVNIRSIEDLAELEDSAIQRLAIPGLREKQKTARIYLDAMKTTSVVAAENAKLKDEVGFLRGELGELRALINKSVEITADTPAEPKRRGRPPKAQVAA